MFPSAIWLSTLLPSTLSSSPLFLCCFTSPLPACHPLPLLVWLALFSLLCYMSFLALFQPAVYFHIFSHPLFFLPYSPSSPFIILHIPCLLFYFLPLFVLDHSLSFFHPTPLAHGSGQCSPSILAQAGGRWVSPWLHTRTDKHMHTCVHTQTCWGWWLMSNARLSASMPIRAAQETSLGLLATAWHWLRCLPACLFHSGKNLKSWGYTLLNIDNHK